MLGKILEMGLITSISLGLGVVAAKIYAAVVGGVLTAAMNPISAALLHAGSQ